MAKWMLQYEFWKRKKQAKIAVENTHSQLLLHDPVMSCVTVLL